MAVPKAIESETTNNEQAVVTGGNDSKDGKSSKPDNAPIGKDITSDPNANGNGFAEASDLSFLSDLAWGLLTPGQQAPFTKVGYKSPRIFTNCTRQGGSIVTGKL